jgi:hypothetical protein
MLNNHRVNHPAIVGIFHETIEKGVPPTNITGVSTTMLGPGSDPSAPEQDPLGHWAAPRSFGE